MTDSNVDIAIIGGGISGFAAAIAAATENKSVLLLDKNSLLGGDSVNTNVGTICGAFTRSNAAPKAAGNAFTKSFYQALHAVCPFALPVAYHNGLHIIPYEWEALLKVYDAMLSTHCVQVKSKTC